MLTRRNFRAIAFAIALVTLSTFVKLAVLWRDGTAEVSTAKHNVTGGDIMPAPAPTPSPSLSLRETPSNTVLGANELECLEIDLKSTRQTMDWSMCSVPFADEDHTVEEDIPPEVSIPRIVFLTWEVPGNLCNQMGIVAGLIQSIAEQGRMDVIALPPYLAETAWTYDWKLFSKASPNGILMDCIRCTEPFARCDTLLYQGKLFNMRKSVLRIDEVMTSESLFHIVRPMHKGYMPPLVDVLQPKAGLKRLVEHLMTSFRNEARRRGARTTVGVHRRTMDGFCYSWFESSSTYQCFRSQISQEAERYKRLVRVDFRNEFSATNGFQLAGEDVLEKIERQVPIIMTCNYTMSPHQVDILNQTWPILFENGPVAFLIADDGQAPRGRRRFEESNGVQYWQSLDRMENPACFKTKKHHYMMADMYGMALSDLHMGMVISSCDDVVAAWRRKLGRSVDSSYPPGCYNGMYTHKIS